MSDRPEQTVAGDSRTYSHCATCGLDLTDRDGNPGPPCPDHGEGDSVEYLACPVTTRPDYIRMGLQGCGSNNLTGPDDEGWYDCLDCGLAFSPPVRPYNKLPAAIPRTS